MPASRSAVVKPTDTSLVLDALTRADDFLTTRSIAALTKLSNKSTHRALWYLQSVHAVEAVTEADKTLHWFATPDYDQRLRPIEERRREDEPRKPHKRVARASNPTK